MNERQLNLLRSLLAHLNEFRTIGELAVEQDCSVRTIRNDLDKIEKLLERRFQEGKLERRPGIGVSLRAEKQDFKKLMEMVHASDEENFYKEDTERRLLILYYLLMADAPLTLTSLAKKYYVNKAVIKEDLEWLDKEIASYGLTLTTRQNYGTVIEGREKDKRGVLAKTAKSVKALSTKEKALLQFFDPSEIKIVQDALKVLQATHEINISPETQESLVIHILFTIKRIYLNQPIELSKKEFRAIEGTDSFRWSETVSRWIEKRLNLVFPVNEKAYLALHFHGSRIKQQLKAEEAEPKDGPRWVDELVLKLLEEVSDFENLPLREDQALLTNLQIHLRTTANRIEGGLAVTNPLLREIKKEYPHLFYFILTVVEEFNERLGIAIPEEEVGYLTVHFQAALERVHMQIPKKLIVGIVCHFGIGVSAFLQAKIERYFPEIEETIILSAAELKTYLQTHRLDLVVTTESLPDSGIATLIISPLLNEEEVRQISRFIRKQPAKAVGKDKQWDILRYTQPFLAHLGQTFPTAEATLNFMVQQIISKGYVKQEYLETVLGRESHASTGIGMGIALPHGDPRYIRQSSISCLTFRQPIKWGSEQVSLVFLLAVKKEELKNADMKQFFVFMNQLMENPLLYEKMLKEQDRLKFLSYFKMEEQ